MKKLLLISSIFLSLSINAQKLTPTISINQPGSADSFWGGYTFAYATSGTPLNGALMSFGGFGLNNYDCQLSSNYFQSQLAFRTRNGDAGVWNPWTNVVTVGTESTQNHLTKFGNGNDLTNSIIYDDGTNVGIGTVPDYKLTVNGNFKTINGNNEFSYNGAADIILKYADRGTGGRAIVHDTGNTLVLNYGSDFKGGTRIGNDVFFKDGGNSFIQSGRVGIGTNDPKQTLTVDTKQANSNAGVPAQSGTVQNGIMRLQVNGDSWGETMDFGMNVLPSYAWIQATNRGHLETNYNLALNPNGGNVGIGTTDPKTKLHVFVDTPLGDKAGNYSPLTRVQNPVIGNHFFVNDYLLREHDGADWFSASYLKGISIDGSFFEPTTLRSWIKQNPLAEKIEFGSSGTTYMSVGSKVGIGTDNPDELLTVNGTIHAKEVKVSLDGLADYVFHPTYKLMPLPEVEQYVKTNSHLPEIPSASEVAKNGMSIGEMQNKLLQKVEELTLYSIQQNKKIEALENRILELEEK
jgi:hypothetical protein